MVICLMGKYSKSVRKLGQVCQELGKCCANMESIIVNKINENNSQTDTTVTLPLTHRTSPPTESEEQTFLQEKPFLKWACDICSRKFCSEKILKDHKLSSHEGKWFPCTHCSKSFASDNSLKAHVRRHSKQPTKMCELYCKMFFHQSELNQHILSHKKEKEFKCDTCKKSYTHKYELNRHLKACGSKVVCYQ